MANPQGTTSWRSGAALLWRTLPGLTPALLIVALLACVLVPLPTALVDLLLSISLAGAVLLLVVSLKIARSTQFLGFPQLLLLATLYRLAINVSTTRLILSQADAGAVIDAFASFVVRDDLVVGIVMFAIITIVQYVVIARGAERVAEVGARFALDGLPGHQAAIDADLRAGVISSREAAARRAALAERSNFYGAMDGAIRFVKGDAVVGLAITAVNLLAGLVIGVGRMGYTWQQSLDVFGRLTVGDGLLSQIPALLVSLAAGVLVSRVDRERDAEASVVPVWLDPAMLLVPAALLLTLAVVPRMPALAFATTAVALVTAALYLAGRSAQTGPSRATTTRGVTVRFPASAQGTIPTGVAEGLAEVRRQASAALGLSVPPLSIRADLVATDPELRVELEGRVLAREQVDASDSDAVLVTTYRALLGSGPALLDLEGLEASIQEVRERRPAVAQGALSRCSSADLLFVLHALLRSRVPLPPMEAILAAASEEPLLSEASERGRWAELIRTRLAQYWVHDVLDGQRRLGALRVVRCDPEVETELVRGVSPTRERELQRHARGNGEGEEPFEGPLVVVATPRHRAAVERAFRTMVPAAPVLSTTELEAAGVRLETDRWLQ